MTPRSTGDAAADSGGGVAEEQHDVSRVDDSQYDQPSATAAENKPVPIDVQRAVARRQVREMADGLDDETRELLALKGMID